MQRELEKKAKQTEKSVRYAQEIIVKRKFVRVGVAPNISDRVIHLSQDEHKEKYFEWCCSQCDINGHWSWGEHRQWKSDELDEIINPHMNTLTLNSWGEVESHTYNGAGGYRKLLNKYQPLDSICDEAQERWIENDTLCQFEELFRLSSVHDNFPNQRFSAAR